MRINKSFLAHIAREVGTTSMAETTTTESKLNQDTGENIDLLLVDDNLSFLNLASRQFEEHSKIITPRICDNPEEALRILEKEDIDCILSDFKMPEMDGVELLKKVKVRTPDMPFIILTSEGSEEIASKAISAGVTDYIKKGSSSEEYQLIINRIENVVLKNRAENRRKKEQIEYERTLKALQNVSRDLLHAENKDESLQMILDASTNIIGLPSVGIYLSNNENSQLKPAASTEHLKDVFGEMPVLDGNNNSITWRSFSNSEIITENDVRDVEKYTGNSPLKSGIWAPIGDKGIIAVLSEDTNAFDERDCQLIELLASSAETALERLEKEERLRESKNRYRTLINNLPNGSVTLFDQNLRFQTARGETIKRAYGSPSKIEDETVYDVYEGEALRKIESCFKKALDGQKSEVEAEISGINLKIHAGPLKDEEGNIIAGLSVAQDITGKKQLERNLRKMQRDSEAMARSMIEAVEDYAIFRLDTEGSVVSWNEGAEEIKGYTEDEIIGEHFSKFYTKEDQENGRPERNLEQARKNGRTRDNGQRVRKDGSKFWADVTITAIRDENGELTGFTKVTEDVTEQRQRRKRMREQLEEFSSIIGHDLKNPLDIAKGYIDLAKRSKDDKDLEKAESALDKMTSIIEDTRIITMQPEELEKEEISLKSAFEEAYDTVERAGSEAGCNIEDMYIQAHRNSLIRMLGNLISNSIKHNTEEVNLRAGPLEDEEGFYYEDDGIGITDKTKGHITEHGFTTSESGRGLGLYIVKRIADLHNWEIDVKDSEEDGARFEFLF